MQLLPFYMRKNIYIYAFPKQVINKSSYLTLPGEVCRAWRAISPFRGCFALEDKIIKSPLLRMDGELVH